MQSLHASHLQNVSDVHEILYIYIKFKKIMDRVMDPSVALTTVVLILRKPNNAQAGLRRKRFNVFTLRNTSLYPKPES